MTTHKEPGTTTDTLYALMRASTWQSLEVNGIPIAQPTDGPQRYIPVFDTQEQALEWAQDGDWIMPLPVKRPTE